MSVKATIGGNGITSKLGDGIVEITDANNPSSPIRQKSGKYTCVQPNIVGALPVTTQSTVYATSGGVQGDEGFIENNVIGPLRTEGLSNQLVDFFTLSDNNPFGNKDRFTDHNGDQVYPLVSSIKYIVDNYTRLGWLIKDSVSFLITGNGWDSAIPALLGTDYPGGTGTWYGFTDMFMPSQNQFKSIINDAFGDLSGPTDSMLGYAPFNIGTGQRIWTSKTANNSPGSALTFTTTVSFIYQTRNKTEANVGIACRVHKY